MLRFLRDKGIAAWRARFPTKFNVSPRKGATWVVMEHLCLGRGGLTRASLAFSCWKMVELELPNSPWGSAGSGPGLGDASTLTGGSWSTRSLKLKGMGRCYEMSSCAQAHFAQQAAIVIWVWVHCTAFL